MRLRTLRARFGERHSDVWALLTDTDRFLSRARIKFKYEQRLREWRQRLQESRGDPDTTREVRSEITAVRRALRDQGWELRLGSLDVALKGFRSDDSVARGFQRMVLILFDDGRITYAVGDANHIVLDHEVTQQLRAMRASGAMDRHYLWYRVVAGVIELAGADTETREAYDRLMPIVEERKSDLVKAFRRLT